MSAEYPSLLAAGVDDAGTFTPHNLFAGDTTVTTDQAITSAESSLAQFEVVAYNSAGALVAWDPDAMASKATRATAVVTFAANPSADDTVTIGGTAITFKASGATGSQVNIGASATLTAAALKTYINATPALLVTATSAAGKVTLSAITAGDEGNAITLAKSGTNIAVSSATLAGGSDEGIPLPAPESKAIGITAQPCDDGESSCVFYTSGSFNHAALTWPAGVTTLAMRKAAFAGTAISVRALL